MRPSRPGEVAMHDVVKAKLDRRNSHLHKFKKICLEKGAGGCSELLKASEQIRIQ